MILIIIQNIDPIKTIGQGMDYVEQELKKQKLKSKKIFQTLLLVEESLVKLIKEAPLESKIHINVTKRFGGISVKLSALGKPIQIDGGTAMGLALDTESMEPDVELTIRNMVLDSFRDHLKIRNHNGRNTVQILVQKSERTQLYLTIGALLAAIVFGIGLRVIAPDTVQGFIDTYVLSSVKTVFMNALKMIVAPVVFFSIVSCVANFGDLREFGKIGGKVIGFYIFTTLIATAIGVSLGLGIPIAQPGSMQAVGEVSNIASADISIFQTILNIVPANIVNPFLQSDMLQIIFIAVLLGVATALAGEHSGSIRTFFNVGNDLFLKATTIIVTAMPLVVFCSVSSLVLNTGVETLAAVVKFVLLVILGIVCMVTAYCILLVIMAKLNPFVFLKKTWPTALTAFSLNSSSASMPVTMKCCSEELGISNKICSFSVPLGATINMDGTCIYLAIASIFLANSYGVALTGSALISMVFSIIVLSVGAPGVPGSGMICLSVLLVQIGVPVEAIGIIMGVDALMGMFRTASNVFGDIVGSLVVAKTQGMLDMDVFYSKKNN